jgi:hypothetical protein
MGRDGSPGAPAIFSDGTPRRSFRIVGAVLVPLFLMSVATACRIGTSAGGGDSAEHAPTDPGAAGHTDASREDFEKLLLESADGKEEDRSLDRLENQLATRCMRDRGWSYEPGEPSFGSWVFPTAEGKSRFGVEAYGLSDSLIAASAGSSEPDEKYSAEFYQDLLGGSADRRTVPLPGGDEAIYTSRGCLAEAREHVYGSAAEHIYYYLGIQEIRNSVFRESGRDRKYAVSLSSWSRCMASHGFSVREPRAVPTTIRERRDAPGAGQDSFAKSTESFVKSIESADVGCDVRSSLSMVLRSVASDSLGDLDPAGGEALARMLKIRKHALRKLRENP